MINGDIDLFLDELFAGEELLFSYKGTKYFVQGWTREDGAKHMECWPYEGGGSFLFDRDSQTMADNATAFLRTPLWDGRTFSEAQTEMEWLDE